MLRALWDAIKSFWNSGKELVKELIHEVKVIVGVGSVQVTGQAVKPASRFLAIRSAAIVAGAAALMMNLVPGDMMTRELISQSMMDMAKTFWTAPYEEVVIEPDPKVPTPSGSEAEGETPEKPIEEINPLYYVKSDLDPSILTRLGIIPSYFGVY